MAVAPKVALLSYGQGKNAPKIALLLELFLARCGSFWQFEPFSVTGRREMGSIQSTLTLAALAICTFYACLEM